MRYWIAYGTDMIRSRDETPGHWEVYNWFSGRWEPAPRLEVGFTHSWRPISAAEALLVAAGTKDDVSSAQSVVR